MHYRTSAFVFGGLALAATACAKDGRAPADPASGPPAASAPGPRPPAAPTTPTARLPPPAPTGPTLTARLKDAPDAPVLHAPRAPTPVAAGQRPGPGADPWTLTEPPAVLVWRFAQDGASAQVDLLAPDGRPWPQRATTLRGKNGLIVEVRPQAPLPVGQPFRLLGKLQKSDGSEAQFVETLVVKPAPPPPPADLPDDAG